MIRLMPPLALLLAACSGCGAAPDDTVPVERATETEDASAEVLPIVPWNHDIPMTLTVDLSPTLTAIFSAQLDWLASMTGLPVPAINVDTCADVQDDCVHYADDLERPTWFAYAAHRERGAKWELRVQDGLGLIEQEWITTLRHELVHLYMFPWPGADGLGHTEGHDLMASSIGAIECIGLSTEVMDVICSSHACGTIQIECD